MPLTPSSRRRERILTFGVGGSGKSHAYVQIAKMLRGTGNTMYLIETDPTLDAVLEHPDFEGMGVREAWRLGNNKVGPDQTWESYLDEHSPIVVYRATDWGGTAQAIEDVWERAGFDDWIVVDNVSLPWAWMEQWYWSEVMGLNQDQFLISIRKAQMEASTDDDAAKPNESKFNHWAWINPSFQARFTDKLLNPPGHLYITAQQADLVERFDGKNKATWSLYQKWGVKPAGQKMAGHLTHTVLLMATSRTGEYTFSTVKDRGGREQWVRAPWTDFTYDYLEVTGKWTQTSKPSKPQRPSSAASGSSPRPRGKPRPKPA